MNCGKVSGAMASLTVSPTDRPACLERWGSACRPSTPSSRRMYAQAWPLAQVKLVPLWVGVVVFSAFLVIGVLVFGALMLTGSLKTILETAYHYYWVWVFNTKEIYLNDESVHPEDRPSSKITVFWPVAVVGSVVAFIVFLVYRTKLRRYYGIAATDGCGDCCLVFWCMPCSVLQEYRHVLRARGFKDDLPPPAVMAYQQNGVAPYVIGRPQLQPQTGTPDQSTGDHGVHYVFDTDISR
mmetsp:Transcript_48684/g.121869  ORF Transcript_48684/g.121869 Transcript_48684/m.121869 type:complete len:239 (-) Transcript_48684:138-854(-)